MTKDWEVKTLDEICTIARGGSPRPIDSFLTDSDDGINWIKIGDVPEGSKYIVSTKQKIKKEGAVRSRKVFPGNFLLSNSMSFGRPYILKIEGCIHDGWLVLGLNNDIVDPDFLYYFLSSQIAYNQLDRMAQGSTVRNINIEIAKKLEVFLPSTLKEQKQIVKILDEKFEAIEKLKKIAEEQLASAKELFESRSSEVFAINNKFDQICLGSTIKLEYGKPLDKSERSSTGTYPVYGANGIKAYSEKYYCNDIGIVVGRKGSAGEVNLTNNKFWPLDVTYFVSYDPNQSDLFYIYYLLKSLKLQQYATGVKPGLNRNDVYAIKVNKYSLVEQKNIVKELNELSEKTKELEVIFRAKISELEELKKSYLHEAFSGKL